MARELFGELVFVLLALAVFGNAYDMQKAAERKAAAKAGGATLELAEITLAR